MFQVVLISALSAAVFLATVAWSARLRRGLSVPNDARRVLVALERATWTTIRRSVRPMALPLAVALCLIAAMHYVHPQGGAARSPGLASIGASLALVSGLLVALGVAALCGYHVRRHAYLTVAGAAESMDRCLGVRISASATIVVIADVLGIVLTLLVHGIAWLIFRGGVPGAANGVGADPVAAELASCFGVGAVIAALALQHAGIASLGASRLAGTFVFESRTRLPSLDPRNPAVLVAAVARQLGGFVPSILDAFVGGSLVTALTLELMSIAPRLGWATSATSIATIPLLLRGFGLLASLFGLVTLRTTEHEEPRAAFIRGQTVAHVVLLGAVVGIWVWLLGSATWPVVVASGTSLLLASSLGHTRAYLLERSKSRKSQADDVQGTSLVATLAVCCTGLRTASWPLVSYATFLALFTWWFQSATISAVQLASAVILGFATPSALSTWHRVAGVSRELGAIGTLAANVGYVAQSDEVAHRLRKVADTTERLRATTDPVLGDAGALLCALVSIICLASHSQLPVGTRATVMVGILALTVVLPSLLAQIESLAACARSTRTQINELDRQLRGMRRDGSRVLVPPDFVPSYRSCVELLARDSTQGGQLSAILALGLPVFAAQLGATAENTAGSMALGLALYTAIAASVGLFATQVGHAAVGAVQVAQRGSVPARQTAAPPNASVSEPLHLVELLGHSLSVSAPLLTKAAALVTLAISASLP